MVSQEFQGEFIRENVGENLYTVFEILKYCFVHEKNLINFDL
jgi:hypothetical protein